MEQETSANILPETNSTPIDWFSDFKSYQMGGERIHPLVSPDWETAFFNHCFPNVNDFTSYRFLKIMQPQYGSV